MPDAAEFAEQGERVDKYGKIYNCQRF